MCQMLLCVTTRYEWGHVTVNLWQTCNGTAGVSGSEGSRGNEPTLRCRLVTGLAPWFRRPVPRPPAGGGADWTALMIDGITMPLSRSTTWPTPSCCAALLRSLISPPPGAGGRGQRGIAQDRVGAGHRVESERRTDRLLSRQAEPRCRRREGARCGQRWAGRAGRRNRQPRGGGQPGTERRTGQPGIGQCRPGQGRRGRRGQTGGGQRRTRQTGGGQRRTRQTRRPRSVRRAS